TPSGYGKYRMWIQMSFRHAFRKVQRWILYIVRDTSYLFALLLCHAFSPAWPRTGRFPDKAQLICEASLTKLKSAQTRSVRWHRNGSSPREEMFLPLLRLWEA